MRRFLFWAPDPKNSAPPKSPANIVSRPTADMIARPTYAVYDPNALSYPDVTLPTVPDNGGYVTAGLGSVVYDGQPEFNRVQDAGPVKSFFRAQLLDNRLKHV